MTPTMTVLQDREECVLHPVDCSNPAPTAAFSLAPSNGGENVVNSE